MNPLHFLTSLFQRSPADSLCLDAKDKTLSLNLARQSILQLRHASPTTLHCLEGALWITQDQDTRDTVIEAGDSFQLPVDERVVVYALQPSRMSVLATRPALAALTAAAPRSPVAQSWFGFKLTPNLRLAGIAEWA